jgi:hypothetical protein
MRSATIPISLLAREQLRALADQSGKSMQAVDEEAVGLYRRRAFLAAGNAAYASLRRDPEAWPQMLGERDVWDGTLADGQVISL